MLIFSLEFILVSALLAIIIDRLFGEFQAIRHPVIWMGDWITFYQRHFYQPNLMRGIGLLISLLIIFLVISLILVSIFNALPTLLNIFLTGLVASTLFAHRMLFDSVSDILNSENKPALIGQLVSRDTANLSDADCHKAAIETYAENLSDGYIAPLFWFLLAGLPGLVIYKAVNTLDSMVGYRNERYEQFGKASAKLDDLLNWIPARLTALMIMGLSSNPQFSDFYTSGRKHDSPNAGHPISAMAIHCQCQLGGDTYYFGELKKKAYFGHPKDTQKIESKHLQQALALRNRLDVSIILLLITILAIIYVF